MAPQKKSTTRSRTTSAKSAADDLENASFESGLAELEGIVRSLEQGGDSLDAALDDYARAIQLMKHCRQKLDKAERRIEILSGVDAEGNPITEPVEQSDAGLDEKIKQRSGRRSAGTGSSAAKKSRTPRRTQQSNPPDNRELF